MFYGGCTQTTTKFFFLFLYFQGVTRKSYPLSSQSERVILQPHTGNQPPQLPANEGKSSDSKKHGRISSKQKQQLKSYLLRVITRTIFTALQGKYTNIQKITTCKILRSIISLSIGKLYNKYISNSNLKTNETTTKMIKLKEWLNFS